MGGVLSRIEEGLRNEVNDSENVSPTLPSLELPNEVWSRIFCKLPAQDLGNVRQACKKWCHIVEGTAAKFRIRIDGRTDLGAVQTFNSKGLRADLVSIHDFNFTYPQKGFGFKAVNHLSLVGEINGGRWGWGLSRHIQAQNITRVLEEMMDAELSSLSVAMPQKVDGDSSSFAHMMILPNLTSLEIVDSGPKYQTIVSDSISIFSNTFPKLENLTVGFVWALSSSIPNRDEKPAQCLIALINFIICHRNTLKSLTLCLNIDRRDLDNILFTPEPFPLVEYQKIKEELEGLQLDTLGSGCWDPCHIRVEGIGPVDFVSEIYESQHSLKELCHYYSYCCDGSFQKMLDVFTGIIRRNEKTLTKIFLYFEEPRGMAYIGWDLPDDRNEFTCAVFQECKKLDSLSIFYLGRNRSLFKITDLHCLPNSIRTLKLGIYCEEILDIACQGKLPSINRLSMCADEYETLQNLRSGGMLLQIVNANSSLKELRVYSTQFLKSDDGTPQTEILLWSDLLWRNGMKQARVEEDGRHVTIMKDCQIQAPPGSRCIRIRLR